jgi:hypothetical protein
MLTGLKWLGLAALMGTSPQTFAKTIHIHADVTLSESDIVLCNDGVDCYETTVSIRPVTLEPGDTLRIHLHFTGGDRLRWTNDGVVNPGGSYFGNESLEVNPYNNSVGDIFNGTYNSFLSFTGVRGNLQVNDISWNIAVSGGNPIAAYYMNTGVKEFSKSTFEFSGLIAQMGPIDGSFNNITGLDSYTINEVFLNFAFGDFSIVQNSKR